MMTVDEDPGFAYQFAGHVETGEDSISDPAMGAWRQIQRRTHVSPHPSSTVDAPRTSVAHRRLHRGAASHRDGVSWFPACRCGKRSPERLALQRSSQSLDTRELAEIAVERGAPTTTKPPQNRGQTAYQSTAQK
jgi:hypothetical protein